MPNHFNRYDDWRHRACKIDTKASFITEATSEEREFEVREWSVCRVLNAGPVWQGGIERIVVMCEVVSTMEGEWREFQVEYSPCYIREHGLHREETLIMHARCQIAAELNHVFGFRGLSIGQRPIVISCLG